MTAGKLQLDTRQEALRHTSMLARRAVPIVPSPSDLAGSWRNMSVHSEFYIAWLRYWGILWVTGNHKYHRVWLGCCYDRHVLYKTIFGCFGVPEERFGNDPVLIALGQIL